MARAVVIVMTGIVIGVVLGAAVWIVQDRRAGPAIIIDDPRGDASIVVAVNGAVASPGLQRLNGEARVQDALDAAGGILAEADLSRINVAQRLLDGDQVIVPTKVPRTIRNTATAATAAEADNSTGLASTVININTANAAQLDTLPHIGPALAQRIIDYRQQHGPFQTVDDLVNVDGISTKTMEDVRPLVMVGP